MGSTFLVVTGAGRGYLHLDLAILQGVHTLAGAVFKRSHSSRASLSALGVSKAVAVGGLQLEQVIISVRQIYPTKSGVTARFSARLSLRAT